MMKVVEHLLLIRFVGEDVRGSIQFCSRFIGKIRVISSNVDAAMILVCRNHYIGTKYDSVAEWLRREIANLVYFVREGSNPFGVDNILLSYVRMSLLSLLLYFFGAVLCRCCAARCYATRCYVAQ
jgi:hypothetical protein